jgi:hypothetical protein
VRAPTEGACLSRPGSSTRPGEGLATKISVALTLDVGRAGQEPHEPCPDEKIVLDYAPRPIVQSYLGVCPGRHRACIPRMDVATRTFTPEGRVGRGISGVPGCHARAWVSACCPLGSRNEGAYVEQCRHPEVRDRRKPGHQPARPGNPGARTRVAGARRVAASVSHRGANVRTPRFL